MLILSDARAAAIVNRLRTAPTVMHQAKDLERASGEKLLPPDDPDVRGKARKSESGPLSPVLLVRGDALNGRRLIIADGYHRICASYYDDEDADIPCRIVNL